MTLERATMAFAGFMILLSMALTAFVHHHWMWLTAFVGANLLQSAFTGFCPASVLLAKLGLKTERQCALQT